MKNYFDGFGSTPTVSKTMARKFLTNNQILYQGIPRTNNHINLDDNEIDHDF
jgi:hypothetical protein